MTGPWRIVAGREIRVRVTDRAFLVSTLAMTVLLIAFLLGIAWPVRAFVRGTSDKALEPLRAARASRSRGWV